MRWYCFLCIECLIPLSTVINHIVDYWGYVLIHYWQPGKHEPWQFRLKAVILFWTLLPWFVMVTVWFLETILHDWSSILRVKCFKIRLLTQHFCYNWERVACFMVVHVHLRVWGRRARRPKIVHLYLKEYCPPKIKIKKIT